MDEPKSTDTAGTARGSAGKPGDPGFRAAAFQQPASVTAGASLEPHPSLEVILDVPVTLSLEVGRTQMSVGNLLRLTQGSVVELDRAAGEPLDVLVNGALVAHGEIVVVNDKFGIRLTDVVSQAERKAS
jgi:flagellar motor switch protein FliN/FliY